MKAFAQFMHQELKLSGNPEEIQDICAGTDRYCMYKVGPLLSISVSVGLSPPSRARSLFADLKSDLVSVAARNGCSFHLYHAARAHQTAASRAVSRRGALSPGNVWRRR